MKKAVLSNRIYMNFDEELYEKLKNELTYKIPSKIPGDPPTIERTYSTIMHHKFITLPIGRIDLIPKDYEIIDKRALNPVNFPNFKHTLREDQQEIFDQANDNCLINANPGWGKTFTAISIAKKLGQKTLVITHTVPLRTQWEDEIKKTLGITPGIIGSQKFEFKKYPIVVANVQTLRKHIQTLRKEFGFVIMDEVHHAPANIFKQCVDGLHARYKIGLSATLRRKDFKHVLIPDYFSNNILVAKKTNQMKPRVLIVKTDIPFSSNNMIPWANRVNELTERPEYIKLITTLANEHADEGHSVLLVSDRTELLENCHQRMYDRSVLVIGATKDRDYQHQLMRKHERDILCGAISIYKEGISENYLSCLILAAPINNDPLLEQLIGRITRKHPNKLQPLIIDIVLKGATAKRQSAARAGHYMRNGYDVTLLDLS